MLTWTRNLGLLAAIVMLTACSDNSGQNTVPAGSNPAASPGFPSLPSSADERVILNGKMTFWMYEGDAGCFGSISDGTQEVELWVDVDTCGQVEYPEDGTASLEVTFQPDMQLGQGPVYTIVNFNQPPVLAE